MKVVTLLLALFVVGNFADDTLASLHKRMSIPPDAKAAVIFGQASHLDWDWLNWFPTNVNNNPASKIPYWSNDVQPTDVIFSHATDYLADANYGYSVCEMGFLRRYAVDNPDGWRRMRSSKGMLSIVGGGITSPDNLLPSGEAFIRDYLVGVSWLKSQNVSWSGKVWLPDDFGHDSQLPVVLQALGVTGASFGRLPGACNQGRDEVPSGTISAHKVLLDPTNGGLDFWWQANDGSSAYTYYQPNGYCCGDGLYNSGAEPNSPTNQAQCRGVSTPTVTDRIKAYIGVRDPLRKTPYMYVATGCDFRVPLPDLVKTLTDWNTNVYPQNGVYAVSASFAYYTDLVHAYMKQNGDKLFKRNFHGTTPTTTFKPTPYWMGFYTSRVANKQLHYETSKALVGAEVFLSLAQTNAVTTSVKKEQLESTWNLTAPSTHHDFITGTATDYVYLGEQQPILKAVYDQGRRARNQAMTDIAKALSASSDEVPAAQSWVAFNQLGFPSSSPTVIANADQYPEIWNLPNVQRAFDGSLLAILDAPSLGYTVHNVQAYGEKVLDSELKVTVGADSYTIENAALKATVAKSANWAVTSLIDKTSGRNTVQFANKLQFRMDNGNIYRYGYEEGCGFNDYKPQITALDGLLVENGPVRITVAASIQVRTSSWTNVYLIQYSLVAGEAFIRVSLNGSASDNTAVITEVQYATAIDTYEHGTPYHWDYKSPFPYGLQQDFKVTIEATHDFIVPKAADGSILGAIYQNDTPAWGVSEDHKSVFGVLLRNSPSNCAGKGAEGHDSEAHYVTYAIRVPSGLQGSASGQPLKEARAFHTPIQALFLAAPSFSRLPETFSLASVQAPAGGIITVAKPGQYDGNSIFFRVYNPNNAPAQVTLQVGSVFTQAKFTPKLTTALEEPLADPAQWGAGGTVTYKSSGALTTLELEMN